MRPTSAGWRRSARSRATARGAPTARSRRSSRHPDACRRRALLDHFGDARPGGASGPVLRRLRPRHARPARPGVARRLPHAAESKATAPRGPGRRSAARCAEGVAHARQRRQARLHGRAQQHAGVDRRAEAERRSTSWPRSRASARRSSSATASRCWRCSRQGSPVSDREARTDGVDRVSGRRPRARAALLERLCSASRWSRAPVTRAPAGSRARPPRRSASIPAGAGPVTPSHCPTSPSTTSRRRWSRWRRWAEASSIPASRGRSARTRRELRSGCGSVLTGRRRYDRGPWRTTMEA